MIFYFHDIRVCRGIIYHMLPNFICYSREKKELKFSETFFASFMILLFSQRIIFCSPELQRFNSCAKITSFDTSRAAFQNIIFHGFLFQFSNQISLLLKFLSCFSIALLGILGIQHLSSLLTDFVCLYNYEFWLSLCKIVRSSVILLLPLFNTEP